MADTFSENLPLHSFAAGVVLTAVIQAQWEYDLKHTRRRNKQAGRTRSDGSEKLLELLFDKQYNEKKDCSKH